MKTFTVRVPDALADEIEATARRLNRSKSAIVRERLLPGRMPDTLPSSAISDLVGSVDGLPADLSQRTKLRLRSSGHGRTRNR